LVLAALQLRDARQRGQEKFSRASEMWLTRQGVEQATSEVIARYKSERFRDCLEVWDLCCGIGGDGVALALGGMQVQAVDLSPLACLRTDWNAEVYGVGDKVKTEVADVTALSLTGRHIHFDPDRRSGPQRALKLEGYAPPLPFLQQVTQTTVGGAIKVSPASNFGGKFPNCEVELISLHGECKEAVIWFGDRRTDTPWRATVLPHRATLTGDPFLARGPISGLGQFIYDPDPAVVRAGLIDVLSETSGLNRLDPAEEYLTSTNLVSTPFATPFEVVEQLPYDVRAIREATVRRQLGELEIKCRHTAVDVDKLRKQLKLSGPNRAVLLIARLNGRTAAVLARRLTAAE
jgi:hypothetical protein